MDQNNDLYAAGDVESNEIVHSCNLKDDLTATVEEVLESVSTEFFVDFYKKCFTSLVKKDDSEGFPLSGSSKEAKAYKKQFDSKVRDIMTETINEALLENVESKSKELKELIRLQPENENQAPHWRPPRNANAHITPFENAQLLETRKILETQLDKSVEEVDLLKTRLDQKRQHATKLMEDLRMSYKNMELMACDKVITEKNMDVN